MTRRAHRVNVRETADAADRIAGTVMSARTVPVIEADRAAFTLAGVGRPNAVETLLVPCEQETPCQVAITLR